jgi:polysaccharide deacetylase family protein (PEP-CTERM system associated)
MRPTSEAPPSGAPPRLAAPGPLLNAFSVDVEDYYQVLNFQRGIPRDEWGSFESRVERNTDAVLELLDEAGAKATFFCLGCVAKMHPTLVRRIVDQGHEVASHGWSHTPITRLDPASFRDEVESSRKLLEDLSGEPVAGFRAPSFSVVATTQWALDVLLDAGYRYDSSIFPVRHPDYGIPGSREEIHRLETPSGRAILEFPMTVARFLGRPVPVSGGGWFRLLPASVTSWGLRKVNREGRPAVFYVHPWELDPGQPNLRSRTSRLGAFRHYTGLARTRDRLARLLATFRFAPLSCVLDAWEAETRAKERCGHPGT